MIVNPDLDVHTKSQNQQKTLRKKAKNNNLLKPKRILYTEIHRQAKWGPAFRLSLPGWQFEPLAPRRLNH